MITKERVMHAIKNPNLFLRHLNSKFHRKGEEYNKEGIDIFSEDWDNLIILDACRYDIFKKLNDFDGTLEKKISRGSATTEFLKGNISDREFPDVTYITANPQYEKFFNGGNFSFVHNIFLTDSWEKDSRTVLPDSFVEKAIELYNVHNDNRIIFHLVQPHNPFIGEFGEQVIGDEKLNFWNRVMTGELEYDDRDLYAAYAENLVIVLGYIEELLNSIEGKTIITADHGQMIGERSTPIPIKEYGHPPGIYTPELVEVPWLVINSETRRDIKSGDISESSDVDESVVDRRLEALGYK